MEDYPTTFAMNSWQAGNIFDSLSRSAVPLFVMLSGTFMLDPSRDIPNSKLISKIIKLITTFLFWAVAYQLFYITGKYVLTGSLGGYSIGSVVKGIIAGSYHMWFFYLLGSLYLLVPLLRLITRDLKLTVYFLTLSFLATFVIPNVQLIPFLEKSNTLTERLDFQMVTGYSFYFVLGFFLRDHFNTRKIARTLFFSAIVAFILAWSITAYGTWIINRGASVFVSTFYGYLFITTMIEAASIFLIALYINQNYSFKGTIISKIAGYTMGIYLMHVMGLVVMSKTLIYQDWTLSTFVTIPLIAILDFLLCWLGTFIMSKIPVIKRFSSW
jgi:surface polysaccharide O-acyltransferase-like enzyme